MHHSPYSSSWSAPTDAQVGVIGLGTMGSMALWHLAMEGIEAIGWEQFRPGHNKGAFSGEARQFRATYLEPEVDPVMPHAVGAYRELEEESGTSLLRITGGLTIGQPSSETIRTLSTRMAQAGHPPRLLSSSETARRFPQHRLRGQEVAIWNEEAGMVRPEHAVVAALSAARSSGAQIVPYSAVTTVEAAGNRVAVSTADQTWYVEKVIITAGAWSWELLPDLVPDNYLGRLLVTWFPVRGRADFTEETFPPFLREVEGHRIYGFPSHWDGTVRIGFAGPRQRLRTPAEFDWLHEPASEIAEISRLVEQCFGDEVDPTPIRTSNFYDAYTPDGQPVLGPVDAQQRIIVGSGFSGRGFKMAPVIGRLLAEVASGRRHSWHKAWDPLRFIR